MDGDKVAVANELVELDIVHMAAGAGLRRVQHQEQMVVVTMDLGHLIPIRRIPNRERMEPEDRPQRLLGLLVPHRYVDPDQPVGAGQQGGQLGSVTQLDSRRSYETDVHVGLLDAPWHPCPY